MLSRRLKTCQDPEHYLFLVSDWFHSANKVWKMSHLPFSGWYNSYIESRKLAQAFRLAPFVFLVKTLKLMISL